MEKTIYCDAEKKDTVHEVTVDKNEEINFTCKTDGCGRVIKFPKGYNVDQIREGLAKHKAHNDTDKQPPSHEEESLAKHRVKVMKELEKL